MKVMDWGVAMPFNNRLRVVVCRSTIVVAMRCLYSIKRTLSYGRAAERPI